MNSIEDGAEHNQWGHGYELTRSDRGLKVWLALRLYGASAFRKMIASHIDLTQQLEDMVRKSPCLEIVVPPGLSVCSFRFTHPDIAHDDAVVSRVNREIEARLRRDGSAAIGSIVYKGNTALRTCFISYRIDLHSVRSMVESVEKAGLAIMKDITGHNPDRVYDDVVVEPVVQGDW